jgi:CRISPR-associated protein Cas6
MTFTDLSFPLLGRSVPLDHGYPLYAALTSCLPALHEVRWLAVHPIGGYVADSTILLNHTSELRLRVPAERIPEVLGLAGARLNVAGSAVRLGAPVVRALTPHSALDARLVLLKLTRPPMRASTELGREVLDNDGVAERYRAELARQLDGLKVTAVALELCGRRSMRIKGRRLLGYSVRLTGLSAEDSVRVQERGLGGRRVLGCGVFRPTRSNEHA